VLLAVNFKFDRLAITLLLNKTLPLPGVRAGGCVGLRRDSEASGSIVAK